MPIEYHNWSTILIERFKFFAAITVCLLTDSVLLLAWFGIHNGVDFLFEYFHLVGKDSLIGLTLKLVLEIPLLASVGTYIAVDVVQIGKRIIAGAKRNLHVLQPDNTRQLKGVDDE